MPERLVRFRPTFFDDLDSLLPDERGRDGRPSATDFLLYELPRLRCSSDELHGDAAGVLGDGRAVAAG
jgi:hypothetical protein